MIMVIGSHHVARNILGRERRGNAGCQSDAIESGEHVERDAPHRQRIIEAQRFRIGTRENDRPSASLKEPSAIGMARSMTSVSFIEQKTNSPSVRTGVIPASMD